MFFQRFPFDSPPGAHEISRGVLRYYPSATNPNRLDDEVRTSRYKISALSIFEEMILDFYDRKKEIVIQTHNCSTL